MREHVRPVKEWAVGRPVSFDSMVILKIRCTNRPDQSFALTRADAERLAVALLKECSDEKTAH